MMLSNLSMTPLFYFFRDGLSLSPCLHCKCRAGSYPSLTLFMWSASRFLPPAACLAACTASPSMPEASQATHSPNDALKRKAVYSWIKVTPITLYASISPLCARTNPNFTAFHRVSPQPAWANKGCEPMASSIVMGTEKELGKATAVMTRPLWLPGAYQAYQAQAPKL